ncbi:MAG: hypothetical protein WAT72_03000, partial [Microgenomates group bacterium]
MVFTTNRIASAHTSVLSADCVGVSYETEGFADANSNSITIKIVYKEVTTYKQLVWNGTHTNGTIPFDFSKGGSVVLSASWNTNGHAGNVSEQEFNVNSCVPATTTTTSTTTT